MKIKNGNANCSNCPYGVEDKEDPLTVSCRRYPPVLTNTRTLQDGKEYDHFQFPAMGTDGVCGEHPHFFVWPASTFLREYYPLQALGYVTSVDEGQPTKEANHGVQG